MIQIDCKPIKKFLAGRKNLVGRQNESIVTGITHFGSNN